MTDDPRVAELANEVAQLRAELDARRGDAGDASGGYLASVLGSVPAFIIRYDADLRIRFINRLQPGLRMEDVIGSSIWDYMPADQHAVARASIERARASGRPDAYEVAAVGAAGALATYEVKVAPVDEPDGRCGVCLVAVDVTEARQRERDLRISEERVRLAAEATGIGLWSWTLATGVVEWDARMREIMGRDEPLDLPRYMSETVHPDDLASVVDTGRDHATGGAWQSPPHRIVRPDGSLRWVMSQGVTEVDALGQVTVIRGGSIDVTERRHLEEQLRHAQRLETVGHLTAGVAHNFNNLLTVITSTLDLLSRRVAPGQAVDLVGDAQLSARRAAELVHQLMTFAGQRPRAARHACDLGALVEHAIAMCRRTFERHIVIEHAIAADLPPVQCAEGEVEQVVMNLLLNARDAVLAAERGARRIDVVVERAPAVRGKDDGVRVQVTDDGVGMTPEVLAHAFDPFFTTKEVGHGTGLGLATSYAIARELGGRLSCRSEPGRGATFELELPGCASTSAATVGHAEAAAVPRARVLVIDDDDAVRAAVAAVLADAGFAVESVASGAEAIARLGVGAPVEVCLLDRSMPGAPGESFIGRIRELSPVSRIVLFSGQGVPPELAARVDGVIGKPASAADLVRAIARVLE